MHKYTKGILLPTLLSSFGRFSVLCCKFLTVQPHDLITPPPSLSHTPIGQPPCPVTPATLALLPTFVPCLTVPWAFLMLLIFAAPSNRAKDLDEGWVKMPTLGVANALLLCTVYEYMGVRVCVRRWGCVHWVYIEGNRKMCKKWALLDAIYLMALFPCCCRVTMCCCCLMHVGKCQNDVPTTTPTLPLLCLRHLQLLMAEN